MALVAFRTSGEFADQYPVKLGNDTTSCIGDRWEFDSPHVYLGFSIPMFKGERRQSFVIHIKPDQFAEVAQQMMNAEPQAAVRAFGRAMQDVQFPASAAKETRPPELASADSR